VFAYEEALGLCVDPDAVRDKDGISAAVLAADLAATLKANGRTLPGLLDALAVSHGVYLTGQVSLRVDNTAALLGKVRDNPPATLTGEPVTVEDLRPEIDALRLRANGIRVVIRPSGTEPKLKTYLQVVEPVQAGLDTARATAAERMDRLCTEITAVLGQ
jgi:phosphomannomutase